MSKAAKRSHRKKQRSNAPLWIAGGIVAAGAIGAGILWNRGSQDQSPNSYLPTPAASVVQQADAYSDCKIRYEQVKSGVATIQSFLDDALTCMPEVKEANEQGKLGGLITNPNFDALEMKLLEGLDPEKDVDLYTRIQAASGTYRLRNPITHDVANIYPNPGYVLGLNVSHYVIFGPQFTSVSDLANDFDARGVLLHELQHVVDAYDGLTINGEKMPPSEFDAGGMSGEFFQSLFEYRATHVEMLRIAEDVWDGGELHTSQDYFKRTALLHAQYGESMRAFARTPLEIAALEEELSRGDGLSFTVAQNGAINYSFEKDGRTITFGLGVR